MSVRSVLRFQPRGIYAASALSRCSWRSLSTDVPEHKILAMPKLSPTMELGTIQEWTKAVGDRIEPGDSLAEIETDKATMTYEYNDEGYLAKIWLEDGASDVPIGTPLGVVVEEEADIAAFKDFDPPPSENAAAAPEPASAPPTPPTPTIAPISIPSIPMATTSTGGRIIASPLARHTAASAGLNIANVTGSGPGGRIILSDVEQAISAGGAAAPSSPTSVAGLSSYLDVPVTKYKKVTAERLVFSKTTIPHYYLTVTCDMDALMEQRSRLNSKAKEGDYKISVTDFIIKASAAALSAVPEVNSSWQGDTIRQYSSADISVAVQTEKGLITPIIRDADRKGLKSISADVKSLAAKARDDALKPDEFIGGTFTVSNLGMYGIEQFCAIVNPPQAAILAVGTSVKNVVPADNEAGFEERTQMKVTLSCDHRVIDGAVGAQWLQAFKRCIEDPLELIM